MSEKIDLLIGGSPCQNFSIARVSMGTKEIEGLNGEKSRLFYEYLRLKRTIEPEFFLLENVKMKKKDEEELNKYIGVNGIHINSKLVSYQLRDRIYWSNIKGITEPEDRKINFQDYKDTDEKYCSEFKVKRTPSRERMWNEGRGRQTAGNCTNITKAEKIGCLTRKQDRCPNSGLIECGGFCRYLTRREIELAQTLPIGYTDNLSYSQMQDVCGDGWTVLWVQVLPSAMERQRAPPKGREAENGSRGIDSRGRIPERLCRCHSRYAKEKRAEAAAGAGKESPPLVFH